MAYKTIMEHVDISKSEMPNMGLFDKFLESDSKSFDKEYDEIVEFFKSFYAGTEKYSTITTLNKRDNENIDVKMLFGDFSNKESNSESDSLGEKSLLKSMMQGVQLRGIINKDGGIESFFMKRDQKNLLAVFFQLPEQPVRKGDHWQLEVNWLTMDHNFLSEKSQRINKVEMIDVIEKGGETIAILKYHIYERVEGDFKSPFGKTPIPTMMEMGLEGICEFSITHGKWKNYSGMLNMTSTGYQNASYTQKFALIELDEVPEKVYQYIEK